MRQIKFRAWDKDNERMLDASDFKSEGLYLGLNGAVYLLNMRKKGELGFYGVGFTLMQFTGLLDKNGKEIWEGDIVREKTYSPILIEWEKEWAGFYPLNGNHSDRYEVIGNVFENPELLTK